MRELDRESVRWREVGIETGRGMMGRGVVHVSKGILTCVDFTAEAKSRLANACADDGTVLRHVIHDFVFAVLDKVPRSLGPSLGQRRQRLKLVTWTVVSPRARVASQRIERTPELHHLEGRASSPSVVALFGA